MTTATAERTGTMRTPTIAKLEGDIRAIEEDMKLMGPHEQPASQRVQQVTSRLAEVAAFEKVIEDMLATTRLMLNGLTVRHNRANNARRSAQAALDVATKEATPPMERAAKQAYGYEKPGRPRSESEIAAEAALEIAVAEVAAAETRRTAVTRSLSRIVESIEQRLGKLSDEKSELEALLIVLQFPTGLRESLTAELDQHREALAAA